MYSIFFSPFEIMDSFLTLTSDYMAHLQKDNDILLSNNAFYVEDCKQDLATSSCLLERLKLFENLSNWNQSKFNRICCFDFAECSPIYDTDSRKTFISERKCRLVALRQHEILCESKKYGQNLKSKTDLLQEIRKLYEGTSLIKLDSWSEDFNELEYVPIVNGIQGGIPSNLFQKMEEQAQSQSLISLLRLVIFIISREIFNFELIFFFQKST